MELKNKLEIINNFPKGGIKFFDITSLIQDGELFNEVINKMEEKIDCSYDKVVALDARGFILGSPISYNNKKGLVIVRKKGKLPPKVISTSYTLEYGEGILEMKENAITKGEEVIIIDDLLATGGTAKASIDLVEKLGGVVKKLIFLIEFNIIIIPINFVRMFLIYSRDF